MERYGRVEIKMVNGKGSKTSDAAKNIENKKDDNRNELKVLVVDDDPLIRKIHKRMLSKFKVESEVVENGSEAKSLFISGSFFDLVLMDMEMPIMDGPTATKELRGLGVKSTIVGITSRELKSEQQVFKEAGSDDCYVKPLSFEKLASILQLVNNKY